MTTDDTPLARARSRDVDRRRQRQPGAGRHARRRVRDHHLCDRRQGARAPLVHPPARRPSRRRPQRAAAGTAIAPLPASTAINQRSVLAENANPYEQNRRLAEQVTDLEGRLSGLLGQQALDRGGLGAPASTAAVHAELEACCNWSTTACCCAACPTPSLPPSRPGCATPAPPAHHPHQPPSRWALVVAKQRIHVGILRAGRTLSVEAADSTWRIYDDDGLVAEVARTTIKPLVRRPARLGALSSCRRASNVR